MTTPYIKPQENGNRSDVDQVVLQNKDNMRLKISGNGFNFSVHPYSLDKLTEATHTTDLAVGDKYYLYIDGAQNALGSESFMYNYVDKYILEGDEFNMKFEMRAY